MLLLLLVVVVRYIYCNSHASKAVIITPRRPQTQDSALLGCLGGGGGDEPLPLLGQGRSLTPGRLHPPGGNTPVDTPTIDIYLTVRDWKHEINPKHSSLFAEVINGVAGI